MKDQLYDVTLTVASVEHTDEGYPYASTVTYKADLDGEKGLQAMLDWFRTNVAEFARMKAVEDKP
jgi:hypothetical protein